MSHHVLEVVMGPAAEALPVVDRADGVYIYDKDGRRYLDATSGCFVSTLGHGVREVIDAVASQLMASAYMHWSQMYNEAALRYACLLIDCTPGHSHVHVLSSGSQAVEAGLYAAHLHHRNCGQPERHKVIARESTYHGATIGAMSATALPGLRWNAYTHGSFRFVARNTCGLCPFNLRYPDCNLMCATDLERVIVAENPDTVSAFLVDPSVSSGWPPDDYWPAVQAICDKYGVLLVADEIKSGSGVTGRLFALQHWGLTPAVNVFGKSAAAGYAPLAGITVREDLAESFAAVSAGFPSGHTFMNYAPACAAGYAALRFMLDNDLMQRVPHIEAKMKGVFDEIVAQHHNAIAFHSMGLLSSLWLESPEAEGAPLQLNRRLRNALMREGVVSWVTSGRGYSRIQFLPPFVFEDAHIAELGDAVRRALKAL